MKSTWKIINAEEGKSKHCPDIQSLMTDNNVIMNQNTIAETFINYFMSIADSINTDNNKHVNKTNPVNYLPNNLIKSLTKSNWYYAAIYEINYKILKITKYMWV